MSLRFNHIGDFVIEYTEFIGLCSSLCIHKLDKFRNQKKNNYMGYLTLWRQFMKQQQQK